MTLRQVRGGLLAQRRSAAGDTLALMQPSVPAKQLAPHRHDDAHWVLVLQGQYRHGAAGPAHAGHVPLLITNPPRTEHADSFAPGQPLHEARFLCLQLDARTWWRWQQAADLPLHAQAQPAADTLVARWLQVLHGDTPLSPLALDELLGEALPAGPAEPAPDWPQRARALLRERVLDTPEQPLPLTELAQRLHLHPVSLARGFRRRWGLSPSAYALSLRLDLAAARLRARPQEPVAEVAAACGFHDQAHLTRQFRAAYGQPPHRWRRRA
ncbi:helix-turn-helix domain-containing protein [Inhella sp.]|uniref:AraC family transcriptional regulator n=1 Tax=Inhella sp. TaxID=1921806 RepID=UPI0035B05F51